MGDALPAALLNFFIATGTKLKWRDYLPSHLAEATFMTVTLDNLNRQPWLRPDVRCFTLSNGLASLLLQSVFQLFLGSGRHFSTSHR
jgi:hypothetical protein